MFDKTAERRAILELGHTPCKTPGTAATPQVMRRYSPTMPTSSPGTDRTGAADRPSKTVIDGSSMGRWPARA